MTFEERLTELSTSIYKKVISCVRKNGKGYKKLFNGLYMKTDNLDHLVYYFDDKTFAVGKENDTTTPYITICGEEIHYKLGNLLISNAFYKQIRNAYDEEDKELYKALIKKQRAMNDNRKKQIIEFLEKLDKDLDTLTYDQESTYDEENFNQDLYLKYDWNMIMKAKNKRFEQKKSTYDSVDIAVDWWVDKLLSTDENSDKIIVTPEQLEAFKERLSFVMMNDLDNSEVGSSLISLEHCFISDIEYVLKHVGINPDRKAIVKAAGGSYNTLVKHYYFDVYTRDESIEVYNLATEEDKTNIINEYLEETKRPSGRNRR